jgi:hypothetical protein
MYTLCILTVSGYNGYPNGTVFFQDVCAVTLKIKSFWSIYSITKLAEFLLSERDEKPEQATG